MVQSVHLGILGAGGEEPPTTRADALPVVYPLGRGGAGRELSRDGTGAPFGSRGGG